MTCNTFMVNIKSIEMTFWDTIVDQHWIGLFASIAEINACFSEREKVLHSGEMDVFANIRSKTYREAWFAGRVLAKQCYEQSALGQQIDWKEMQIVSRNALGQSIVPRLLVDGRDTGFVFSLSHVADKAIVVAPSEFTGGLMPARSCGVGIGCDLVFQNSVTPGIVQTFFHGDEVEECQNYDAIWAVKEAAFKSCNAGDPFQPQQWFVQKIDENRYFCRHLDAARQLFAEAETLPLGHYTLAVARKTSVR